jgi:hypothetical protein
VIDVAPMVEVAELVVYQIRAFLRGVSPMVWRRLLVRSDSTIADLHYILQIAFGWSDFHLNGFRIHGKDLGVHQVGGPSLTRTRRRCIWQILVPAAVSGFSTNMTSLPIGCMRSVSCRFLPSNRIEAIPFALVVEGPPRRRTAAECEPSWRGGVTHPGKHADCCKILLNASDKRISMDWKTMSKKIRAHRTGAVGGSRDADQTAPASATPVEVLFVEGLYRRRMRRGDVRVPHVLPHHRSVL